MRLRDVSEMVRELIEGPPEALFDGNGEHALIQEIANLQTVYRPIATSTNKKTGTAQWLAFSFEPFVGLIEPFKICPGLFWALIRMQRQSSGLPELVVHIARSLPSALQPLSPHLFASFSTSDRVGTVLETTGKDPVSLRFYHKGAFLEPDGSRLPAEACLSRCADALPEGYIEDGIPGLVEHNGAQMMYLGEIRLYNQGRTVDRAYLRNFLLNCVAVSVVARYVRDAVRKDLAEHV